MSSIINKLNLIITKIINIVKEIELDDEKINLSEYPFIANPGRLKSMKGVLIFSKANSEDIALEEGYKRYKTGDGYNGLRCLIYGILFKNKKLISDDIISHIMDTLFHDNEILSILTEPLLNNGNFKYNNIKNQTKNNTRKRHVLDILNTVMCLIDETFSYGSSNWGSQAGKKGWGSSNVIPPETDTLGFLIYIIAFYNVRWLKSEEIDKYRNEFRDALSKCDLPNDSLNRCKDASLGRQIKHIDEILAVQTIDANRLSKLNINDLLQYCREHIVTINHISENILRTIQNANHTSRQAVGNAQGAMFEQTIMSGPSPYGQPMFGQPMVGPYQYGGGDKIINTIDDLINALCILKLNIMVLEIIYNNYLEKSKGVKSAADSAKQSAQFNQLAAFSGGGHHNHQHNHKLSNQQQIQKHNKTTNLSLSDYIEEYKNIKADYEKLFNHAAIISQKISNAQLNATEAGLTAFAAAGGHISKKSKKISLKKSKKNKIKK